MSRRSSVATLPPEVRAEFDQRLIDGGFAGYRELIDWLAERGFKVSLGALSRHSQKLQRRIEQVRLATEQAQVLASDAAGDSAAMAQAAIQQVQARIFDVLLTAEEGDMGALARTARALSETSRALVSIRQERRRAMEDAADAADAAAKKAGLSAKTAEAIRTAIEGAAA